jgi:hypothetical protein
MAGNTQALRVKLDLGSKTGRLTTLRYPFPP